MKRVAVLAAAVLAAVFGGAGCDELRQIDSEGDLSRVPAGGAERLRLHVPDRPFSRCELVPFEVVRVAHEGDDLAFDQTRSRCAVVEMIGPGVFIVGSEDDGSLMTNRMVQLEIDRGQTSGGLFTSTRSGSVVLKAMLLNVHCPMEGSTIAEAQRITTFVAMGAEDCLERPMPDAGRPDGGP
jgi:hypothetical protein